MHFYRLHERATKELAPGALTRTFWGQNLTLSVVEMKAGSLVPAHTHPHEQGGMVLEGEVELGIGEEARTLRPGDLYIIPANVEHWARTGGIAARILDIFSPVREDLKY